MRLSVATPRMLRCLGALAQPYLPALSTPKGEPTACLCNHSFLNEPRAHAVWVYGTMLSVSQVDSAALKEKLTLREKHLFDAGRHASCQYNTWKAEKTRGRIEQSSLVAAQPKRAPKRTRSQA